MIKAIFFDIDGTLRDFTEEGIRPSTRQALRLAQDHHILCFIATGRHLLEIQEERLLDDLTFDGYVLLNGSLCIDSTGSILYENPVPLSQIEAMLKLERQMGFALLFMERESMYVSRITPGLLELQAQIGTSVPPVEPRMERGLTHTVYQMVPYADDQTLDRIVSSLPLCSTARWHAGGALDIMAKGGSKRLGIENVIRHYGFSREEIAAVGDGYNDIPMIQYAGTGIAMGNGNAEVKAAADYITDSIEEDGLLHAVQYLINIP